MYAGVFFRYLCKLTDKELRLSEIRLMADTMWTTVKSPPQYSLIFDRYIDVYVRVQQHVLGYVGTVLPDAWCSIGKGASDSV